MFELTDKYIVEIDLSQLLPGVDIAPLEAWYAPAGIRRGRVPEAETEKVPDGPWFDPALPKRIENLNP